MSKSEFVALHLPYLRRFARALSGSQSRGDACVAMTLKKMADDPSIFDQDLPPRVALYRALLDVLPKAGANPDFAGEPFEDSLDAMRYRARQAFLLRMMEEFSLSETATILDSTKATVEDLIDEAGQEIASQMATDVLIIEDNLQTAGKLEAILEKLGHRVIANARTHTEALAAIEECRPGLVLADIQLADGSSGLDAVNDILKEFEVPVIFVTSCPERLLTGEKPEPSYLIAKPFRPDMLKAITSQALFFNTRARSPENAGNAD